MSLKSTCSPPFFYRTDLRAISPYTNSLFFLCYIAFCALRFFAEQRRNSLASCLCFSGVSFGLVLAAPPNLDAYAETASSPLNLRRAASELEERRWFCGLCTLVRKSLPVGTGLV